MPTRPGTWRRPRRRWRELEPLGRSSWRSSRWRRWRRWRSCAASTSIPLAADESVATLAEAERAVALGACACTGIKLSKVGGPEEALAIAEVLPAYVSSALDGPVGIAAGGAGRAQTLAETGHPTPDLAHGLATQRLFASTIAAVECEVRDGMLHLPPGPGLGVEIDEEALQAHRI